MHSDQKTGRSHEHCGAGRETNILIILITRQARGEQDKCPKGGRHAGRKSDRQTGRQAGRQTGSQKRMPGLSKKAGATG
jgi:hypothetical protein